MRGFTIVEVALVIVAIALIGGIGFYVYQANQKPATTASNTQSTQTAKTQPQKATYTDPNFHYSFSYPSDWKTQPATQYISLVAKSPDYVVTNEPIGPIVTKGATLSVNVYNTTGTVADFVKSGSYSYAAKNIQPTKVAGLDAMQYTFKYEGNPSFDTTVVKDGHAFEISISYADDAALQMYRADYDAMVASFTFNQ